MRPPKAMMGGSSRLVASVRNIMIMKNSVEIKLRLLSKSSDLVRRESCEKVFKATDSERPFQTDYRALGSMEPCIVKSHRVGQPDSCL